METDRWSLGAMAALAALCVLAGILPGFVIDGVAPVVDALSARECRRSRACNGSRSCRSRKAAAPTTAFSSSSSSLSSAALAAYAIHRFASKAVRRAPAWDCGYPDASPATQYSAGSFAQPIRRVFGSVVFRASEHVDMPPPGDMRPAHFRLELHDLVWEFIYAPIIARRRLRGGAARTACSSSPSAVYLSLVFCALVAPAAGARRMAVIIDLAIQSAQMLLVLAAGAAAHRLRAQGEGAAAAPARPAAAAALPRSPAAFAQGGRARRKRLLAVPRHPLSRSSPRPGSPPSLVPTFAHRA